MNVEKQIDTQIAHCLACYGDTPDELMTSLKTLILDWYTLGLSSNQGVVLNCPHCEQETVVYHLQWTALTCHYCKKDVERPKWLIS